MDATAERRLFFEQFKQDQAVVFVIEGPTSGPDNLPFMLRKLDDERVSILAWIHKEEAEKWRVSNVGDDFHVTELSYIGLENRLKTLSAPGRQRLSLEVI
jgi:hypothetical protein